MREVLFRGKRIDNGEWVEGYFGSHSGIEAFILDRPYISVNNTLEAMNFYEVTPSTVGQYTGLQDKNGKRIFEGDIVRIVERGKTADGGIIAFENGYPGGWLVTVSKGESKCSLAMRTDVEVIGNIHDNPELLGGNEYD